MLNKDKKRILFVSAELNPLVKVGGLADVLGSLPKALAPFIEPIIIMPFYGAIDTKKYPVKLLKNNLKIIDTKIQFSIYQTFLPQTKIKVLLVKNSLFSSKDIYSAKNDAERFAIFSKCVVESIRALPLKIDLVHCHDWHSALVPTIIDEYSIMDKNFSNIPSLLTIHNLASQGLSHLDLVDNLSLKKNLSPALMEDYYDDDKLDQLKIGILSADMINTVSSSYAKEILSKEYGFGLEKYLLRRKKNLAGILNGIDTDIFDPTTDKFIYKKYNLKNYHNNKAINKQALQKELKLEQKNVPIFAIVSRLVKQKGLDILSPLWDKFLNKDLQIVILGTGERKYEQELTLLNKKYPKKFKAILKFDAKLAQKIYAASDFFLMPSYFEPCGLGQMIAMRYGSLPIVREIGGLKDTVKNKKTGLVFTKYDSQSLEKVWQKSLVIFADKKLLAKMIKSAMSQDFSWDKSALEYLKIYKKLIK